MASHRARAAYAGCALATVGLGLLLWWGRPPIGPALLDFLGDALWGAMIFGWAGALALAVPVGRRAAAALAVCAAVEVSQLYHPAWLDALRGTAAGHLVLGSGFDARDLVAYTVGVAAAALVEGSVRRFAHRRRRSRRWVAAPLRDFSVRGAVRCAEVGRLEAWVHTYLRSGPWANLRLSNGLRRRKRYWVGPVDLCLEDLDRCCGPEEGMTYPEPVELWERRVEALRSSIVDPMDLPPLIVNAQDEASRNPDGSPRFLVADGSHRLEALRRLGCRSFPILIWFESEAKRSAYLRGRRDRPGPGDGVVLD